MSYYCPHCRCYVKVYEDNGIVRCLDCGESVYILSPFDPS